MRGSVAKGAGASFVLLAAAGVLVAVVAAIVGGISSIGLMSAVNFAIDSDFKWLLLSFALVWALSLVAYGIEGQRGPFVTSPAKEPCK